MLAANIVDLEANDGWQAAASKINANFRNLRSSVESNSAEGTRSAADELMGQLEAESERFREEVSAAEQRLDEKIAAIQRELDAATQPEVFAPPVGTYMFSEADPSETWSGTEWERQPENLYLVASGENVGGTVGSNEIVLSSDQMPQHSHTGPAHTHTMAHTHAHAGSGAAASSAGAHKHTVRAYSSTSNHGGLYTGSSLYRGQVIVNRNAGDHNNATFWTGSDNWNNGGINGENTGAHTHSLTGNTAGSSAGSTGSSGTGSTGTAGGSAAIDNRPLSQAVPLWKRTA